MLSSDQTLVSFILESPFALIDIFLLLDLFQKILSIRSKKHKDKELSITYYNQKVILRIMTMETKEWYLLSPSSCMHVKGHGFEISSLKQELIRWERVLKTF